MNLSYADKNMGYKKNKLFTIGRLFGVYCCVTILIFTGIYFTGIDLKQIPAILSTLHFKTCIQIICLYMTTLHIVALRNYFSFKQFNISVAYSNLILAQINAVIGGILPIFGAAISQSVTLYREQSVPSSTSIILYFYDKIVMTAAGLILTLFASYFLMQNWSFLSNFMMECQGSSIIEFIAAILITSTVVYVTVIPKEYKDSLSKILNKRSIFFIGINILLSMMIWNISAKCFFYCLRDLYPGTLYNNPQITAACFIVSFLSSMPISVNGWGIREFSAISIFSILAIPAVTAISVAITIGILSTLSIYLLSLIYFTRIRREISYSEPK